MPTLADIAARLGLPVPGGEPLNITGIATLGEATANDLSYVGSEAFVRELAATNAGAIIVPKRVKVPSTWTRPALSVDDAELAVSEVVKLFASPVPRPPAGVDAFARVDPSAIVGEGAAIGPFVFVGRNVKIGAHTVLHPSVYIGDDTTLGEDCEIFPNVTIRERITLGNRVVIHANSAIGTDGFGYRWDGAQHRKVLQIGAIIIEDDVEIGSCSCVDRAKFSVTRLGRGTKIDNLVQVAHNVQTGMHCILVGQSGLAGSVKLGNGVVIGGQTAIRDHVTLGDGAMVAGSSGVAEDVPPGAIVSGTPALPHRQNLREQKALRKLPDLQVQIKALQAEIEAIKKK